MQAPQPQLAGAPLEVAAMEADFLNSLHEARRWQAGLERAQQQVCCACCAVPCHAFFHLCWSVLWSVIRTGSCHVPLACRPACTIRRFAVPCSMCTSLLRRSRLNSCAENVQDGAAIVLNPKPAQPRSCWTVRHAQRSQLSLPLLNPACAPARPSQALAEAHAPALQLSSARCS